MAPSKFTLLAATLGLGAAVLSMPVVTTTTDPSPTGKPGSGLPTWMHDSPIIDTGDGQPGEFKYPTDGTPSWMIDSPLIETVHGKPPHVRPNERDIIIEKIPRKDAVPTLVKRSFKCWEYDSPMNSLPKPTDGSCDDTPAPTMAPPPAPKIEKRRCWEGDSPMNNLPKPAAGECEDDEEPLPKLPTLEKTGPPACKPGETLEVCLERLHKETAENTRIAKGQSNDIPEGKVPNPAIMKRDFYIPQGKVPNPAIPSIKKRHCWEGDSPMNNLPKPAPGECDDELPPLPQITKNGPPACKPGETFDTCIERLNNEIQKIALQLHPPVTNDLPKGKVPNPADAVYNVKRDDDIPKGKVPNPAEAEYDVKKRDAGGDKPAGKLPNPADMGKRDDMPPGKVPNPAKVDLQKKRDSVMPPGKVPNPAEMDKRSRDEKPAGKVPNPATRK